MLRCWKRLAQDKEMWTQHAQVLEETGAGQRDVDTACSGVGRDWRRTKRCGHSMLRCWKRLEQDKQMRTQHAQVLEETGEGHADVDTVCSGIGRDWRRTKRCGHSMLRCWKRLAQDKEMWTQHAQVLEETGAGQADEDTTCSGVGRDWRRTGRCGHSMLRCWKRLAKDRQMWTQYAQALEETGAGQRDVDTACSGVGRDWRRTGRCEQCMLRFWKRLAHDRQMWTQYAQVLEESGVEQTDVDTACLGVGRDWRTTDRCGHSMLRCWKKLAKDRQMWTQHAQVLEETGAGQAGEDTSCSGVGRDWRRTKRCGHSMLRCWKRLAQDRQMRTQHAQALEETGAGQADEDTSCSGVGRDWRRTKRCGHSMLRCWKRLAQGRQMRTQHAQVLEETGAGQADVNNACSDFGRDWHMTGRCGHSMLRCWKRVA